MQKKFAVRKFTVVRNAEMLFNKVDTTQPCPTIAHS